MSSESEDEFQSADEGSDSEKIECITKACSSTVPSCKNAINKIKEDGSCSETGMDKIGKDTTTVKGVAVINVNNFTSDETGCVADMPHPSHQERVSVAMLELSIMNNENEGERAIDQLHLYSKDRVSEVNKIANDYLEKLEGESTAHKCLQEEGSEYNFEGHVKDEPYEAQSKGTVRGNDENIEEVKEKPKNTEISSVISAGEPKLEYVDDGLGILGGRKPKPIKQSKIGMKKPREKLGERIGARKLNVNKAGISTDNTSCVNATRQLEEDESMLLNDKRKEGMVVSKSTDRTSCDDPMRLVGDECDKMLTDDQKCLVIGKESGEHGKEEDEISRKRQQWEEQQERWHQALNLEKDEKEDSDGWAAPWGGWGNTLLSAATTFTREVGRGVGTVMETVESSIGAPSPEIVAQEIVKEEQQEKNLEERSTILAEENKKTDEEDQAGSKESPMDGCQSGKQLGATYGLGGFSLGSFVSGVSGALETASSKVLLGGLDTLEVIGRKAMDVIQEGDPGLRRKRAFLSNKKPNLSQALQEARQRAAEEERERVALGRSAKSSQKPSFEQAWEDSEGPVHLEALSLVAKQCLSKKTSMAATLPHYLQNKLQGENNVIKSTCELDEELQLERDLVEVVPTILAQTGLPLHPQKMIEAWLSVQEKAILIQEADLEKRDEAESELYGTLAKLVTQLCALAHKGGELALISPEINPLDVAFHFRELAQVVSGSLENMTDQVCGAITSGAASGDTQIKDTIANIYLQAATCNSYIQQSLVSLASVLQYSNTKLISAQL